MHEQTPISARPLRLSRRRSTVAFVALSAVLTSAAAIPAFVVPSASAATATVGLWPDTATPSVAAAADASAVEVGVKFKSSTAGTITGLQFYKGTGNTGTHTASLWTAAGKRLASATFGGESATGWQTVAFAAPVAIAANTTYVASYYAPKGRYSYTTSGYGTAKTSGVLTAPSGTNGVYRYGTSGFPTSSYKSTNYWVDVLFVAGTTPTPSPTTTTTASPSPTTTTTASPSPTTTTTASPSPTTTTTASPSPTTTTSTTRPALCTTNQVWANLDACGWPGPATTGYPDGMTFSKTVTSGLVVTQSGAVIDGYDVSGGIRVAASNVTIRNSRVRHSAGGVNGSGVVKLDPGASATIENSVLDGTNATHACIWHEGSSLVARRNECLGTNDGIFSWASQTGVDGTGDNFTIEDNWLHGFTEAAANGHVDGYQTEGSKNGVLRHNTIDVAQSQTSAIAIWNGRKNADNILVDGNLLQGGGFSVYAEDYSPSEASPAGGYTLTNVRFTNNVFSNSRYACVGDYGVWFNRGAPSDGWKRTGNKLLETGQNLDNNNPIVNGWECR